MDRTKILAIASGGGHWEQLMQISSAFSDFEVIYACTNPAQAANSGVVDAISITDYNKNNPLRLLRGVIECFSIVRSVRPSVALSTGAAPGLVMLAWAKLFGAKTIWIDSIANAESLSLSGKISRHFVSITLTQWEHLADGTSVNYVGGVL